MKARKQKATARTRSRRRPPVELLTLDELAWYVGVPPAMIAEMLEFGLLEACRQTPEPCFPPDVIPQVRRILRLHAGLDVHLSALPLVLELLDRIQDLERRLAGFDG